MLTGYVRRSQLYQKLRIFPITPVIRLQENYDESQFEQPAVFRVQVQNTAAMYLNSKHICVCVYIHVLVILRRTESVN